MNSISLLLQLYQRKVVMHTGYSTDEPCLIPASDYSTPKYRNEIHTLYHQDRRSSVSTHGSEVSPPFLSDTNALTTPNTPLGRDVISLDRNDRQGCNNDLLLPLDHTSNIALTFHSVQHYGSSPRCLDRLSTDTPRHHKNLHRLCI